MGRLCPGAGAAGRGADGLVAARAAISAAAVVTMRPLWLSPSVTAVRLSRPWSCSSLMRLSTMTS